MYSDVHSATTQPSEIAQLLDEHHLVVVGDHRSDRTRFGRVLIEQLGRLPDSEVVRLDGERIHDIHTFCKELRGAAVGRSLARDTVEDVIHLLRTDATSKHLYFVWLDADVLLAENSHLFGRLANALIGAAAERELISPERLVLQRTVFLGDRRLGDYAANASGQLCTWLLDDGGTPFWEVVTCLSRPPVLTYRI